MSYCGEGGKTERSKCDEVRGRGVGWGGLLCLMIVDFHRINPNQIIDHRSVHSHDISHLRAHHFLFVSVGSGHSGLFSWLLSSLLWCGAGPIESVLPRCRRLHFLVGLAACILDHVWGRTTWSGSCCFGPLVIQCVLVLFHFVRIGGHAEFIDCVDG